MATSSTLELDDPLAAYGEDFGPAHARRAQEYFDNLVATSGVNAARNAQTVSKLRDLEARLAAGSSQRKRWLAGLAVVAIVALGSAGVAFSQKGAAYLLLIITLTAAAFLIIKVRPVLHELGALLRELQAQCDATRAEAWSQMEALNRLHQWDVPQLLFQQTFREVELDRYVAGDRLDDLQAVYGLNPNLGDNTSVLLAQGGTFRDNPFVLVRFLEHWTGTRRYEGSLHITWTEHVRQSDGRVEAVHRSETLRATVNKPFPEFQERTVLLYGHEAAPSLTFSRRASRLSHQTEGAMTDWRKERQVKKVERMARHAIASGAGLTVMANREFEALFCATDRDDEVGFRLLFTPLAQQQMVQMLKDQVTGYGDNFSFTKTGPMNVVEPAHLADSPLDGDPRRFCGYDLAEARRFFIAHQAEYFRALYFGLLPLLTIPLYRERRATPRSASSPSVPVICPWEHESMANYRGEATFQPAGCVTRSLLKTASSRINDSVQLVQVTAYGYGAQQRVDHVPVRGGDGRVHVVAVPWTEYIGLQADRQMLVGVVGTQDVDPSQLERDWSTAMALHGVDATKAFIRGPLAGTVL